ncbi:MAG: SDR family oxidoreductase [Candidatus Peregrinibacteria bacterium]|nr:SDR family oxidoreductase [Candidatus Peregrinibacteria bacterium]
MKILITGGAGFLGSHLCETLLEQGHEVIALDSLLTGDRSNLEGFEDHKKFRFIQHDITEDLNGLELPDNLDRVYHLACPASPVDYQEHPLRTLHVSSQGTWNMLQLALDQGARFLFTSTSEVYGDPKEHPQKESYWGHVNPIGPRSCYDEGKRFAESLIVNFKATYPLDARMVRIFNTYGPRMRKQDGRVIPNFIGQALAGEPITIYGDGSQTRSFCYVSDMMKGLIGVMETKEFEGPVNWGNPQERTVRKLAETVIKLTNSSSTIEECPLPQDDPTRRCPDISKAKSLLGFEPEVSLEEGLQKTIDWIRS